MPEGKKAAVPAPKPVREEDLYSAKTHLHQPVPVQETATVSATAQLADAPEGAQGHWQYGAIDWAEFKQVLAGNGPCNRERLAACNKAHREGAWVREAALAHAAKRSARRRAAA